MGAPAGRVRLDVSGGVWRAARKVCEVLWSRGKECYAVGGAVRDALMGKEPRDVDLATDATPDEMKRIFEGAGCTVYPTGEKYGTVTVTCDGESMFEVTTYRGERYRRHSRKPEVTFAKSLLEDLSRRDFTVNAMALDLRTGEVIDPFGGLEDLKRGIVRAVGDPERRFREDPLRIFRMCRFAATLGFSIDERTMEGAKRAAEELEWIPYERMTEETRKALVAAERPSRYVACLVESGAMRYYIPELYDLIGLEQPPPHAEDAYEHTLAALDATPPDYVTRMAALLHDIGKPRVAREGRPRFPDHERVGAEMAREILRRTRHSRREVEEVAQLVEAHGVAYKRRIESDLDARRALRALVKGGFDRGLLDRLIALLRADLAATKGMSEEERRERERAIELLDKWKYAPLERSQLEIDGSDLLAAGVEPRAIGAVLEKLVDWVVEDPTRNRRDLLMQRALALAKSMGALRREGRAAAAQRAEAVAGST